MFNSLRAAVAAQRQQTDVQIFEVRYTYTLVVKFTKYCLAVVDNAPGVPRCLGPIIRAINHA
jgi:hypothetical protein